MNTTGAPQTFARTITVCAECGATVLLLDYKADGSTRLDPCGHVANLKVIDNPLCPAA